eukprot:TRINITY_DN8448_c1_g1_i1.p1 TRINITY_DN8448_c1_g1~~TRINITY_DN8448_c1_g1_i1.p1  ORF type:complete len:694 (+),score=105.37 TRINITY_DN8448_c1_g1_i1:16-2097(+)
MSSTMSLSGCLLPEQQGLPTLLQRSVRSTAGHPCSCESKQASGSLSSSSCGSGGSRLGAVSISSLVVPSATGIHSGTFSCSLNGTGTRSIEPSPNSSGPHSSHSLSIRRANRTNSSLHQHHDRRLETYVDPSKWGITKRDLSFFEQEVRRFWAAGMILDAQEPENANPHHDDPCLGPTIHQVNEHYIKPVTKDAGGMSWALMRNPQGVMCDVFASHCWRECVIEFVSKATKVWPQDAKGMYVCFLANPQNSDFSELLEGDLLESPFARALSTARYMVVIPNQHESIYLRLWCVFEMHLALEKAAEDANFEIKLPAAESPTKIAGCAVLGVIIALAGSLASCICYSAKVGSFFGPLMWLLVSFVICELMSYLLHWLRSMAPTIQKHLCMCNSAWLDFGMIFYCYAEMFLMGITFGFAYHDLLCGSPQGLGSFGSFVRISFVQLTFQPASAVRSEDCGLKKREILPCSVLALTVLASLVHKIFLELVHQVIRHEGNQLDFESVKKAKCSEPADEVRILAAVKHETEEIDCRIRELRVLGRYNRGLKNNLARGTSMWRARDNTLLRRCLKCAAGSSAWCFWWVTELTGRGNVQIALVVLLTCISTSIAFAQCAGEESVFAVHSFYVIGLVFAIVSNGERDEGFLWSPATGSSAIYSTSLFQAVCFCIWMLANFYYYYGRSSETEGLEQILATSDSE